MHFVRHALKQLNKKKIHFRFTLPILNRYTQTANLTKSTVMLGTFYNFLLKPLDPHVDIQKACDASENTIMDLMIVLKRNVLEACKEYRDCISKQIEVTKLATEAGPTAKEWDEVTKYRVQADELKERLSKYEILSNTIGLLAHDQSSVSQLTNNTHNIEVLCSAYNEMADFIQTELQENKRYEDELLKITRDSILKTK